MSLKPLTSKTSKEKVAKYKIQFSLSSIKFKSISKKILTENGSDKC
jgi:hypothetical protein